MERNSSNLFETQSHIFMDVVIDYAFKRIFANSHNKNIQLAMLNDYLRDYIGEIEDLELLPTDQVGI